MKYYLYTQSISSKRIIKASTQIIPIEREAYSSLFYYDETMRDFLLQNGSVSNFQGKVYGNYFVLDIDDKNIDNLIEKTQKFFDMLKKERVRYYLFYSGKKGFHLYIPKEYVKYPRNLENKWNIASYLFAQKIREAFPELKDHIDLSVYDKVRMFRLPFSTHPDSGKSKSLIEWNKFNKENPLKSFTLLSFDKKRVMQEILTIYKHIEINYFIIEIEETKNYQEINYKKGEIKPCVEYPYGEKLCIYKMLNTYNLTGMRHKIALILQSYWKEKGYSKPYVQSMLLTWSKQLNDPLKEKEILSILNSYERGYIFNCKNDIKQKFCITSCFLYKSKEINNNYIYMGDDYVSRYLEDLAASKDKYIYMNEMFPEWNSPPIKPGYTIVLAGGAGSGKTTFILNIMKKFSHINWLFLSLEMAGVDITEKMLKIAETNLEDTKSVNKFKKSINHIITIDKPDMGIEEIKDFVNMIKAKTHKKIHAIVIDYLSLVRSRGGNQTERVIQICMTIKKLVKDMRVVVFILSQVPKDLAGDSNIPLGLNAPKDSGEIVNLADMLWTCWRPNKNRAQTKDDIFTLCVPKDRHGPAGYYHEFKFIPEKYQIKPGWEI